MQIEVISGAEGVPCCFNCILLPFFDQFGNERERIWEMTARFTRLVRCEA